MNSEKVIRERFKIFEKLIKIGYNTDKKILDLKVESLLQNSNFNRSELIIAIGIKEALSNRRLVSFLCGIENTNEYRKENRNEQ